eukprot:1775076-Pyramimonas_sp.AAC.1
MGVESTLAVIGTGEPVKRSTTQLGEVAPPIYRLSIYLLDRAVLDVCPPGSGGPKPLDRGDARQLDRETGRRRYRYSTNRPMGRVRKGNIPQIGQSD